MHLLRRMGKCNGGANERTRECEIARVRASRNRSRCYTRVHANVCDNIFSLFSLP